MEKGKRRLIVPFLFLFCSQVFTQTQKIKLSHQDESFYLEIVKDSYILEIDESRKDEIIKKLENAGYTKIKKLYKNFYSAVNKKDLSFYELSLTADNDFKIYPNRIFRPFLTPSDQYFSNQYYLFKINAPLAWDFEEHLTTITLALVDSGITPPLNPDFDGIVLSTQVVFKEVSGSIINREEYLDKQPYFNSTDPGGFPHGTMVAGVAAAIRGNQTRGIAGVYGNFKIYSFDVFDDLNDTTEATLIAALNEIKERLLYMPGKVIINMSLGSSGECSAPLQSIISDLYSYSDKFILVAAAGNDGIGYVSTPANCSGVVAVSATDEADKFASFSNYGSHMKSNGVSAPGTNIFTTFPGSAWGYIYNYQPIRGTSFSAPIVSGVMAGVWAKKPRLKNYEVIDIVKKTARDVDDDGPDKKYGWGIVDMFKALSYVESDITDKNNRRITAWPNPFYISRHGYIRFSINDDLIYPGDKLMIYDFSGAFVAWATKDGTKGFVWDGKNSGGWYVAPGLYIAYYKSQKGSAKTKFLLLR